MCDVKVSTFVISVQFILREKMFEERVLKLVCNKRISGHMRSARCQRTLEKYI
jgi:hypothetical protein